MTKFKTVWRIITIPFRHFGSTFAFAATLWIVINALFLQSVEHPSPMVQSPRQTDTLQTADLSSTAPQPSERAIPATPLPPSAVPLPQPRRDDPIADKIANRIIGSNTDEARSVRTDDVVARLLTADTDLAEIQAVLQAEKLYTGAIDGLMGARTEAAMRAYVEKHGLTANGSIVSIVSEHLKKKASKPTVSSAPATDPINTILTVSAGPSGAQVRAVQRVLAQNGYAPGPVDGILSAQTREAIRRFERDRDMTVTGEISEGLMKALEQFTGEPVS